MNDHFLSEALKNLRSCKHAFAIHLDALSACLSCGALRDSREGRAVWVVPTLVKALKPDAIKEKRRLRRHLGTPRGRPRKYAPPGVLADLTADRITTAEAARRAGVSEPTARRWRNQANAKY